MMTDAEPHILIVDDHQNIREPLARYLDQNGMRTTQAANGKEANRIIRSSSIDLVVLDILMPGESGLDICRRIRETRDIPVILLTAMAEDTDRIVGLEVGADDYVTKPFNPRELLARIRSVLRRVQSMPPQMRSVESGYARFGKWQLDTGAQRLLRNPGKLEVTLSTGEYRLLSIFLQHPKHTLSRDQLLDLANKGDGQVFDRSIDNLISRLRRKLGDDPKKPELIKTVWAAGYMLTVDVTWS